LRGIIPVSRRVKEKLNTTMSEYELLASYFIKKQELCFEKQEQFIEQTDSVCLKNRTLY
jgi:hypothetical protein